MVHAVVSPLPCLEDGSRPEVLRGLAKIDVSRVGYPPIANTG